MKYFSLSNPKVILYSIRNTRLDFIVSSKYSKTEVETFIFLLFGLSGRVHVQQTYKESSCKKVYMYYKKKEK